MMYGCMYVCMYVCMFSKVANKIPKVRKMLKVKKKENIVTTLVIGHPNVKYYRTVQKERPSVFMD